MAISPKDRYPGQIDVSDLASYPRGAAQNLIVPGDGTGTPWEKDLVNDIFGFQQALLAYANFTPSGVPDKVGASQYLDALFLFVDEHGFSNLSAVNANISNNLAVGGGISIAAGGSLSLGVGGNFLCDGTALFTGVTTFSFPVGFTGGITVSGSSAFNGALTLSGTGVGLKVTTDTELDGTLLMGGLLTAGAGIIAGTAGILIGGGGALLVTGATTLQGPVEIADPVTLTGNGRIRQRILVGADADASYGPGTVDLVRAAALTGTRQYTIDDTGAVDGDSIEFANFSATQAVGIHRPGGALLTTITFVSGSYHAVRCVRIAGTWEMAHLSLTQ